MEAVEVIGGVHICLFDILMISAIHRGEFVSILEMCLTDGFDAGIEIYVGVIVAMIAKDIAIMYEWEAVVHEFIVDVVEWV